MSTEPLGLSTDTENRTNDAAQQATAAAAVKSSGSASTLFCTCGGLFIPDTHGWTCQQCSDTVQTLAGQFTVTNEQEHHELKILSGKFFRGPRTSQTCPECGHDKAYYQLLQLRSADESETQHFTCEVCEHTWRKSD